MFIIYLKQAFRNFKTKRLLSSGAVATLLLGSLSISFLVTYLHNELSMNTFHQRCEDIYVTTIRVTPESRLEVINSSLFFNFNYIDYPALESLTTVQKYNKEELKFSYGNSFFSPEGIVTDSSFFKVFGFKLIVGNKNTILSDSEAIILTEPFAKKVFGQTNPIGQMVTIDVGFKKNYIVKGIASAVPSNSSITFDFILPGNSAEFSRSGANFILARPGFNLDEFSKKIAEAGRDHPQFSLSIMGLLPLNDIYYNNELLSKHLFSRTGDKKTNLVLYIIVIILFLISVLNFSNLQIVNINSSIKDIGIKRISGGKRIHLLYQKLIEVCIVLATTLFLLSMAYIITLPYFNRLTGIILDPPISFIIILNLLVSIPIAVAAMLYPTLVLYKTPIIPSLRNQLLQDTKLIGRHYIIIGQFTLSIFLIMFSFMIVKQLNMMLEKDLGFNSHNIIKTKLIAEISYDNDFGSDEHQRLKRIEKQTKDYQYVINELEANPLIELFSQQQSPVTSFSMPWNDMSGDYTTQNTVAVNPAHNELFGFEMVEGRFFDPEKDRSRGNTVVINEAALKHWNIKDISTARLNNKYWHLDNGYKILGVVRDFNYEHLSSKPQPLVMCFFEDRDADFLIKLTDGATQSALQFLNQMHNDLNPNEPFRFTFLSDEIANLYQKEKKLGQIYILFTFIALLISISGLFTIVLYDTQRRIKEIGIRKANGAKIWEVMALLNKDFIKWVAIAFIIATPVAWYAMHQWLQNFAYKTELSWWIFALAGLLALGLAMLTVSWQSWQAARRNPVEALRNE